MSERADANERWKKTWGRYLPWVAALTLAADAVEWGLKSRIGIIRSIAEVLAIPVIDRIRRHADVLEGVADNIERR